MPQAFFLAVALNLYQPPDRWLELLRRRSLYRHRALDRAQKPSDHFGDRRLAGSVRLAASGHGVDQRVLPQT